MNSKRPERKQIRLRGYDYSQDGYYFVTICARDREEFFGEIRDGIMGLNEIGLIAAKFWQEIPEHFENAKLDEWIIMPNHVHGIVVIENPDDVDNDFGLYRKSVGGADLRPLQIDRTKMLLPKIIHGFKSSVTRYIRQNNSDTSFGWQRSFYDHIIRNERSFENIFEYIRNNPQKWSEDVENRKNQFSEKRIKRHYNNLFIK